MTLAKRRQSLNATSSGSVRPRVFYMTDSARHPDPLAVVRRLPRGAGVIYRHYDHPGRDRLAATLARLCRRRGLVLLIGNDPRLALAVEAQGVHFSEGVGRNLVPPLRRLASHWLVSMSVHSFSAVAWANRLGVDLMLASSVFPTPSHPGGRTLGIAGLARLCRKARCPVYALGGVTEAHWPELQRVGAAGLAGIGLFDHLAT